MSIESFVDMLPRSRWRDRKDTDFNVLLQVAPGKRSHRVIL